MFASNFWTHDYISGINALMQHLEINASESRQVLEFLQSRVVAEREYSSLLSYSRQTSVPQRVKPSLEQFASVVHQTTQQSSRHLALSDDIDKLCYEPLASTLKTYQKNLKNAHQLLKTQFTSYNKLRQRSTRLNAGASVGAGSGASNTGSAPIDSAISTLSFFRTSQPNLKSLIEGQITLAGIKYSSQDAMALLYRITKDIVMTDYKVPLIGTYGNVSTGAAIASASRRHLKNDSIAYSDKFGQSLVDNGLLKPVAQISNKFQNSHQSYYQWQPGLLDLLGQARERAAQAKAQAEAAPSETANLASNSSTSPSNSPGNLPVLLSPPPPQERSASPGLAVDTQEYLQSILELDMYRCNLEQDIFNVYNFLEKCELERLTVMETSMRVFRGLVGEPPRPNSAAGGSSGSGSPGSAKSGSAGTPNGTPYDELLQFTKKHRSGPFVPNVAVYRSPRGAICQTFGVELEKTQFFTSTLLSQLQDQELPIEAWTTQYQLEDAYKLRSQVNTGRKFNETIFRFFSAPTIVATLLQYYLELPESLVPFSVYDLAKTAQPKQVVAMLDPVHLETLKLLLQFLRARYDDHERLGDALAHYLFRPRAVSALTMDDKHPAKLLTALLRDYDEVFDGTASLPGTPRTPQMQTSPRPGSRLEVVGGNRPRTSSSGSAFETSNGTHLIPLTLSPDAGKSKSQGPRLEMRHGLKLSGVLPIRSANNSPIRSRSASLASTAASGLDSPIKGTASTPATPDFGDDKSNRGSPN